MGTNIYPTSRGQLHTSFCAPYYPYWSEPGVRNPKFDRHSGRILSLKDPTNREHMLALKYFNDRLPNYVKDWQLPQRSPISGPQVGIVIVPSSTAGRVSSGLQAIMQRLCQTDGRFCMLSGALSRVRSVPKAAKGGPRSVQLHKQSIVCTPQLLHTRYVMLVDDVASTGSSLIACCELIQDAVVATNVIGLALGQTTYD